VHFVADLDALRALPDEIVSTTAAMVIEPLIQGVNEMRPWPPGMLRDLRAWCDEHGIHLILDEVMTGFGRTGRMFACQHEDVIPDFLCLAKGLTGGYLPMAATLTTAKVYDAFLGTPDRAFYYGHSYTANPLGCTVALASLEIFESERTLEILQPKIALMSKLLADLKAGCPSILDIRQCGFIAGIEFDRDAAPICLAARDHGLLTRPIRNTVVLMPPLCITNGDLEHAVSAIRAAARRPSL
jgi:adenosylmethionine-8-amino-7-oxononanoate aminotransferase